MRQGKDLILSDSQTGSGHFACATSCTVSVKSDYIEVAHPTEGGWKRYKPTILSWSASTGHLLASYSNYKYFRSMMESKHAVTVRFYDVELQIFYKGQAYIETLDLTGDVNGLAKMKVSLQPSGPLEEAPTTDYTIDTEYSNQTRGLYWNNSTKRANIFVIGEEDEENGVVYQPLTLTAMRNRITVRPKRALLNRNQAQVENYLTNQNNDAFNSAMLVFPYSESESIVVGPGSYTVVVNYDDQDGGPDFMIMSSF